MVQAHAKTGGTTQEWVRAMLSTVGRGGNAQAVRDEILNIMHRHHIKEQNGTWMEQWHQKLHQNTTPEDITICEAYLAFLESGSMDDFWRVAWDNGRLTPEYLAKMDQPITRERHHHFSSRS